MQYKISELVAKTGITKSTILYYIREGLLPEALKIKSNVHRYSDEHLELLKYIKYMKQEMGSSNEQIKNTLKQKNQSFSSSYSMLAPLMQTLSGLSTPMDHYSKSQFLSLYNFKIEQIERLLQDKILHPLGDDDFTQKDASIVELIIMFEAVGVEYEILKKYVSCAKELALIERELQEKLCGSRNDENFSTLWKIMFETLFNAKEYIFKRHTHATMVDVLKEEIKRND